ncbi:MAG TPA: hypothetical protein VFW78_13445 [Bacteroidia bacterium]|nr:hypothetical protein [Bacteroidia bacterium]
MAPKAVKPAEMVKPVKTAAPVKAAAPVKKAPEVKKAPVPKPAPKPVAEKPAMPKTETTQTVTFIPPATTIRETRTETTYDRDDLKGKSITKITEIESDIDSDDDEMDDFKLPGEKLHDWGTLLTSDEDEDEDDDDDDDRLF